MKMRSLLLVPLAVGLAACGGEAEDGNAANGAATAAEAGEGESRSIGDALAESPDHARFMEAAEAAGLTETLRGAGPYTVFAPVNAAFEGMESGEDGQMLDILSYHIVPGAVTREDLVRAVEAGEGGRAEIATVGGGNISVARDGDALVLTDGAGTQARIVEADRVRSNGVLHSIDAVLRPGG